MAITMLLFPKICIRSCRASHRLVARRWPTHGAPRRYGERSSVTLASDCAVSEKGTVWFSDSIDLKQFTSDTIALDLRLKPGTRVVGRLADDVPRPVKNGRVVARIIHGADSWSNWNWYAKAEIDTDGTFTFDPLPPDENLQMIAICDGWVSCLPTHRK